MPEPTMTRDGEIFVIDFGSDENTTNHAWARCMGELLDQVDAAAGPKILVTTGSGKHYSNGLDVGFMGGADRDSLVAYLHQVMTILRRVMLLGTPTVAAVNGHAFGMGAFLTIAHDQAVMREDRGYFCLPEVHLDMSFPVSLMSVLQATLTPKTLRHAVATGYRYSATEAEQAGIVRTTASIDELVEKAIAMGRPHAATAGPNLALLKRQMFPEVVKHLASEPQGA